MIFKLLTLSCLLIFVESARLPNIGNIYTSRVVGGRDARPGEFPHQVSLQWGVPPVVSLLHFCGGSIISENWILTAGHCMENVQPFGDFVIKAGKIDIDRTEEYEQMSEVIGHYVHENFPETVGPFDIALLKLKTPLKFNEYVAPVKLPKRDAVPIQDLTTMSGWGSISPSVFPEFPSILQTVDLPIIDLKTCNASLIAIDGKSTLHETNICTGPLDGGFASCSGDSGGPLITNDNGENEIVGIVSWGLTPCGAPGAPSVFVRVSAFIDWIEQTISKHSQDNE